MRNSLLGDDPLLFRVLYSLYGLAAAFRGVRLNRPVAQPERTPRPPLPANIRRNQPPYDRLTTPF